jgi:monomeric isocitrate dehydrogenase
MIKVDFIFFSVPHLQYAIMELLARGVQVPNFLE